MQRPWSIVDFILVVLGGFLGAGVVLAAGLAFGQSELILVLGLAGQYLGHLLVFWLIARTKEDPDVGFAIEARDVIYLAPGLLLQLALAILFLPLTTWLFPEGDSAQQIQDAISSLETSGARLAAILVAVVLAPVTEELTFRGVFLKALEDRKRWVIIVVSSLVFAIFHLPGLDPNRILEAAAVFIPQLFLIGAVLAWVTLRSGRLGPAIFLHSGYNLLAAIALLLPESVLERVGG